MKVLSVLALAAVSASSVSATTVYFSNKCTDKVNLYDNGPTVELKPGDSHSRTISEGFRGMFRDGASPQATLAEFTMAGGKAWFDISIIPTGPKSGPDYCPSLEACKKYTGGVGYNTPMQIAPRSGQNGAFCRTVTCLSDGCADGYQYPKDDTKTHNCPGGTDFDVTFCPGGHGGETTAPPPTTAPPTTAPPTTTPTPTQKQTEKPTDKPTETPTPTPTATPTATPTPTPTSSESAAHNESSQASETPVTESTVISAEPDAAAPATSTATDAPASAAPASTPSSDETPVEANVQASGAQNGGNSLSTILVIAVAVAAVAGVAVIVVYRRKKAELDEMDDKSPMDSIVGHSELQSVSAL